MQKYIRKEAIMPIQILSVLIASGLGFAFGLLVLITLWREGVKYRRFGFQVIGASLATPVLYAMLVFVMSFAEYPLGW